MIRQIVKNNTSRQYPGIRRCTTLNYEESCNGASHFAAELSVGKKYNVISSRPTIFFF